MDYIKLCNGLELPSLGMGTFPLKGEVLTNTLSVASKNGYKLFDTAWAYDNETEIGVWKDINNADVILSSKVDGPQLLGKRRFLYLDKETVTSAYRHSCKRLKSKSLDIFLLHCPMKNFHQAYSELLNLYDKCKVKAIGVCNFDIDQLKYLYKQTGHYPMIHQTEISPKNSNKDIIHFCQDNNIVVEAFSPFGRGNLVSELLSNPVLKEISSNHKKSVGQIVLRWITQQNIIALPRSTNEERIIDNINIFDFKLSKEEIMEIDKLNENKVFGYYQINR